MIYYIYLTDKDKKFMVTLILMIISILIALISIYFINNYILCKTNIIIICIILMVVFILNISD